MKQGEISKAKSTEHVPIRRERDGAEKAVVFIHGFMGSPGQFSDLMETVYDSGYSCFSVLLPGHGVRMREFAKFGDDDWELHVQDEIAKIRGKYSKIVLVGHSIGGLLALNISLNKENHIAGVMLISTPLKVYLLNPKALLQKLRLMTYSEDNEIKAAYIKANGISKSNVLSYPLVVKPLIGLYKLIRRTRKRLADVFVPVYIFHSESDETVSPKSAKLLHAGLCNTRITTFPLNKSWHAYYHGDERNIIMEKLLEFIQRT